MIESVTTFIGQNWLATTISILAIFFAIYESKRRRGPLVAYQFTGQRVIGAQSQPLPDDVQILFEGSPIQNLTKTQIIMWNKGDAPIRGTDIPDYDPIRYSFGKNTRVLLAEITKKTRDVNRAAVQIDPNSIKVMFDFLDRADGVLVTVWHDSADSMPDCSGTIVGQKRGPVSYGRFVIKRRVSQVKRRPSKTLERIVFAIAGPVERMASFMPILFIVLGILFLLLPFLQYVTLLPAPKAEVGIASRLSGLSLGALYLVTGIWFLQSTRPRFPKTLLPDEFFARSSRAEVAQSPQGAT